MIPTLFGTIDIGITIIAYQDEGIPAWAQVALGIATIAVLLTKQLVPGWVYKEKVEEISRLTLENQRLTNLILDGQKEVLPALSKATSVVEDAMTEMKFLRRRD